MPPARRQETESPSFEDFARVLASGLEGVRALTCEQITALFRHYTLFQRWNKVLNLSSISDFEAVVSRHYCESIFLATQLPAAPSSIVDIGSGAGFPGVPIAVLHPSSRVCLVESRQRKATFLKEATRRLPNVEVRCQRAEDPVGRFDWLVSRAVAWKDLEPIAADATSSVALLSTASDAREIMLCRRFLWWEPTPLPWGRQIVLLIGEVSRGT